MGKISCKTKRSEKFGKGMVTPIQVAFIVDRYLIDNNYTQTVSVFRSEAFALLSKYKMREAPKSLLSLECILNEYISLKEQRMFLDQEKSRVEKLLLGMQEVMKAYQSTDSVSVSSASEHVLLTTTANSTITNSAPTLRNVASQISSTASMVSTVPSHNNKKKVSKPYSLAKNSFAQSPTYLSHGSAVRPPPQEVSHNIAPATTQHFTGNSKTQTNSHQQTLSSSSLQGEPTSNGKLHQSSTKGNSSSPKTPSQQHSLQTDSYRSPLETSSSDQSMDLSPKVTTTNDCVRPSGSNENTSGCGMYEDYQQCYSPSSFGTKRLGKLEHIKGRLDFDDSSAAVNSDLCVSESSGPATMGEKEGVFDIDDLLNFNVLDSDVSLSYLIDFDLDSQVAALADQSSLDSAIKLISSSCGKEERSSETGGAFSNFPFSNTVVLTERDLNRGTNGDGAQLSKPLPPCSKANSPGRKRPRFSVDQENVLIS